MCVSIILSRLVALALDGQRTNSSYDFTAMAQLEGQVAIVTGASSGIGLACCQALQSQGAKVVMCARNEGRLAEAATKVPNAITKMVDVVQRAAVQAMVNEVNFRPSRAIVFISNRIP
jgi:NADP-dependent 3-hydroxy acid dehydrogenase YdfG